MSVFVRNRCPLSAGTAVRFPQDLVSEIAGICSLVRRINKFASYDWLFDLMETLELTKEQINILLDYPGIQNLLDPKILDILGRKYRPRMDVPEDI